MRRNFLPQTQRRILVQLPAKGRSLNSDNHKQGPRLLSMNFGQLLTELPKLTSIHVSSARSVSEDQISSDLPTTMAYEQPITIRARSKTDLWREPPNTDVSDNAPTCLISTPIGIDFIQYVSLSLQIGTLCMIKVARYYLLLMRILRHG